MRERSSFFATKLEALKTNKHFLDVLHDRLFDKSSHALAFDPESASNPSHNRAMLTFREGQLEAKRSPYKHHQCCYRSPLLLCAQDGSQRVAHVTDQEKLRSFEHCKTHDPHNKDSVIVDPHNKVSLIVDPHDNESLFVDSNNKDSMILCPHNEESRFVDLNNKESLVVDPHKKESPVVDMHNTDPGSWI